MRNFEKLIIWQKSMDIVKQVYSLSHNHLPDSENYGIKSQITRCAVSIPSNIAEGCSRTSIKDYNRFLEISMGSAFELHTQLLIIKSNFQIHNFPIDELIAQLVTLQKQINVYQQKIKNNQPQ